MTDTLLPTRPPCSNCYGNEFGRSMCPRCRGTGLEPWNSGDVIAAFRAIDTSDPERAHEEADRLMLEVAAPYVAEEYQRIVGACSWWATS